MFYALCMDLILGKNYWGELIFALPRILFLLDSSKATVLNLKEEKGIKNSIYYTNFKSVFEKETILDFRALRTVFKSFNS